MDTNGYPTKTELKKIATWSAWHDFAGWMAYIKSLWAYADWGWHETKKKPRNYRISTAGWSGNESIIVAMQKNFVMWSMHWYSSRCGGHYVLKTKK